MTPFARIWTDVPFRFAGSAGIIPVMGQVITFPAKREPKAEERRAALVTGLCAMTYVLGFFLVGPSLAIYAFGFATTAHPASALACVAGLAVTWAVTRVAYKRL